LNTSYTISCLREGNQAAFKTVFFEYHERIYAYVLRKTHSSYLAEETLQLTFIKLWKYRDRLSDEHSLFTQIFRITTTTMIDLIRKEQTQTQSLKNLKQAASTLNKDGAGNNVRERMEENELKTRIAGLLREMPGMQKKVFEMSRLEGKSYNEIATTLSISVKTVETHISRALKFLRRHLTPIILVILTTK